MTKTIKGTKSVTQGIGSIVNSTVRTAVQDKRAISIPLNKVRLDPDNARNLTIGLDDLPDGPNTDTDNYETKKLEYENLREFADEIKKDGLIQPIIVYKKQDDFILIAGERRTLACTIAGFEFIEAIVHHKPENSYKIARLQWNENDKRKDLKLSERLHGLRRLIKSYHEDIDENAKLTPQLIIELANCSMTQAHHYFNVLNNDFGNLQDYINTNKITNLEKASLIAKIKDEDQRNQALDECLLGASYQKIKDIKQSPVNVLNNLEANESKPKTKLPGRQPTSINLGKTQNSLVAKTLIEAIVSQEKFTDLKTLIPEDFDWNDLKQTNSLFKKFIASLDKQIKRVK